MIKASLLISWLVDPFMCISLIALVAHRSRLLISCILLASYFDTCV